MGDRRRTGLQAAAVGGQRRGTVQAAARREPAGQEAGQAGQGARGQDDRAGVADRVAALVEVLGGGVVPGHVDAVRAGVECREGHGGPQPVGGSDAVEDEVAALGEGAQAVRCGGVGPDGLVVAGGVLIGDRAQGGRGPAAQAEAGVAEGAQFAYGGPADRAGGAQHSDHRLVHRVIAPWVSSARVLRMPGACSTERQL